jgi:hypothetical protein
MSVTAQPADSAIAGALPGAAADALAYLVDGLAGKGMRVLAVDRTTRELAAVGLRAV